MRPIVVFNHTLHKKLWDWLASHPGMHKEDWPGWSGFDMTHFIAENRCFACETVNSLAIAVVVNRWSCRCCPLDWGEQGNCWTHFGLYNSWYNATAAEDTQEAARLARVIRDLPVREPEGVALVVI